MTNSPLNLPTLAAAVAGLSLTDGVWTYEVSSICKGRQMTLSPTQSIHYLHNTCSISVSSGSTMYICIYGSYVTLSHQFNLVIISQWAKFVGSTSG